MRACRATLKHYKRLGVSLVSNWDQINIIWKFYDMMKKYNLPIRISYWYSLLHKLQYFLQSALCVRHKWCADACAVLGGGLHCRSREIWRIVRSSQVQFPSWVAFPHLWHCTLSQLWHESWWMAGEDSYGITISMMAHWWHSCLEHTTDSGSCQKVVQAVWVFLKGPWHSLGTNVSLPVGLVGGMAYGKINCHSCDMKVSGWLVRI